jgi:hypothetical protein
MAAMSKKKFWSAVRTLALGSLAIAPMGAQAQLGSDDVLAVGPISAVSASGSDFSVLGRAFHADDPVSFGIGDYVAVHGQLMPDGSISGVWVESMGRYVPGSDPVYEKGVITEMRPFLGQLSIGGSRLDYTPALSSQADSVPEVGSIVAVSGLQPNSNGFVLVDSLMASADRVRDSLMKGGGVQSSLMKGGGIESSLMKGGGVQSSLMKGGGIAGS